MIDKAALVNARVSRVLTQYRESPNLLGLAGAYLAELTDVMDRADAIPDAFDLDTSTGDQLTLIGRWLGFVRTHREARRAAAFGFARDTFKTAYPVGGFCEGAFFACPSGVDFGAQVFDDDAVYRGWLKARRRQINAGLSLKYTRSELTQAAGEIFGASAVVVKEKPGVLTICLTRLFTDAEKRLLRLAGRVMPAPPGVRVEWAHADGVPFGFGDGWGENCTASFYGVIRDNLDRAPKSDVFGFGPDYSGLCEGFFYSGNPQDLE